MIALAGTAIVTAAAASAVVAGGLAFGLSVAAVRAPDAGPGALFLAVVLVMPVLAVVTMIGPFVAGLAGGLVADRPIAAIGSVGGLMVGYWAG
jgi:hypothetical protein